MKNNQTIIHGITAMLLAGVPMTGNAWWFCPLGGPGNWFNNRSVQHGVWGHAAMKMNFNARGYGNAYNHGNRLPYDYAGYPNQWRYPQAGALHTVNEP